MQGVASPVVLGVGRVQRCQEDGPTPAASLCDDGVQLRQCLAVSQALLADSSAPVLVPLQLGRSGPVLQQGRVSQICWRALLDGLCRRQYKLLICFDNDLRPVAKQTAQYLAPLGSRNSAFDYR
jgi:hypothetical protein